VRGIVKNGPIRRVTEELARLDRDAERAEHAAERWEQIAARFDAQRAAHRAEDNESTAVLRKAEGAAEQVRAEVAGPLTVLAEDDVTAYLAAVKDEAATRGRLASVGRFGRRKARAEHRAATEQARTLRAQVRDAWDAEPPRTPEALPTWAIKAAARRVETDPRVSESDRAVEAAHSQQKATRQRHQRERRALLVGEYGAEHARRAELGMGAVNPRRNADDARRRAALIRAEADELRGLTVNDAARRIETKRAEQELTRRHPVQRARQLDPYERDSPPRPAPGVDRLERRL
jgi:hypothetical protein